MFNFPLKLDSCVGKGLVAKYLNMQHTEALKALMESGK